MACQWLLEVKWFVLTDAHAIAWAPIMERKEREYFEGYGGSLYVVPRAD
jgi:hypothetical protein